MGLVSACPTDPGTPYPGFSFVGDAFPCRSTLPTLLRVEDGRVPGREEHYPEGPHHYGWGRVSGRQVTTHRNRDSFWSYPRGRTRAPDGRGHAWGTGPGGPRRFGDGHRGLDGVGRGPSRDGEGGVKSLRDLPRPSGTVVPEGHLDPFPREDPSPASGVLVSDHPSKRG